LGSDLPLVTMGFGDYDEDENQQQRDDEQAGESVDKQGESYDGDDGVEDDDTDEMLQYLNSDEETDE